MKVDVIRRPPGLKFTRHDPTLTLRNPVFVRRAILEALEAGDYEGVRDILRAHLDVIKRSKAAAGMKVSRQYIHRMITKPTVPSLRTFTAFMHMLKTEQPQGAGRASAR